MTSSDPTTPVLNTLPAPVEWFCSDSPGTDSSDRQLFGTCEPAADPPDTDETGRIRFSLCEAVGQLGPIAGDANDDPYNNPDDLPVRAGAYIVQPGDFALEVAAEFCVTVGDLGLANGWSDSSQEFPLLYTITKDDTTRSGVAKKFCVSVQALDTANLETVGYSSFAPGVAIIILPSTVDTC